MQVAPDSHTVYPVQLVPPHCPYLETGGAVGAGGSVNEVIVDLNVETEVAVTVSVMSSVMVTVAGTDGGDASAVGSSADSDVSSGRESAELDVTPSELHSKTVDRSVNTEVVTTASSSGIEVTDSLMVVVLVMVAVETSVTVKTEVWTTVVVDGVATLVVEDAIKWLATLVHGKEER